MSGAKLVVEVDVEELLLMCDEHGITIDDHTRLQERLQRLQSLGALQHVVRYTLEQPERT